MAIQFVPEEHFGNEYLAELQAVATVV